MATATPPAVSRLQMEGELTIYTAQEIKRNLLDALTECHALALDLSSVTELDTAGVQLLMMAKQEAERLGKEVQFLAPSSAAEALIDLYRLAPYLGVSASTAPRA